ncbi:hypothetical protein PINS_up024008 [Pythium insidiosum]|nr:hypothetical protein PINS_up024008 [Pythium insidiosum]
MYDFCLTIPYGVLLGIGGLIGYVNSGSATSIIAGGASGVFLTLVGYASYQGVHAVPCHVQALAWSLACRLGTADGRHGAALPEHGRVLPAGFVAATSAGMSLFYLAKLVSNPKPKYKKKM